MCVCVCVSVGDVLNHTHSLYDRMEEEDYDGTVATQVVKVSSPGGEFQVLPVNICCSPESTVNDLPQSW